MENGTLKIEYEVSMSQLRNIWFDYFKAGLPSVLAFWGTAIFICLLALYFFSNKIFPFIMLFAIASVLISLVIINYLNFNKAVKANFSALTENERLIQLTFQKNTDGFDCINGKSFSHIAWESIKQVTEFDEYFLFDRSGNIFLIPKNAFKNDAEINFLRVLISAHLNQTAKLLN